MNTPDICVRPQTIDEECCYVLSLSDDYDQLSSDGYSITLPNHEMFKPNVDVKLLEKIFRSEIYSEVDYVSGVEKLQQLIPRFMGVWPTFELWQRMWNFDLFSDYVVSLTLYGTGGMYLPDEHRIVMMTDTSGNFVDSNPLETMIHEFVHLGIENPIVARFNLDHWEKERVVDLLCEYSFKDVIPNYKSQKIDNEKLDMFITSSSIGNLPIALMKYFE